MNPPYEDQDDEREFASGSDYDNIPAEDPQESSTRITKSTPEIIDLEEGHDWTMEEEAIDFYGLTHNIQEIISFIGDDVSREGLVDTPRRVVESWRELYSGYKADIASMMTTFDKEQYDQMVVLQNIEFFSTCEHHMLPFTGIAHVAYIPDKRIIGISKLARLVDAFSRRLQNQERITTQVTAALDTFLEPKGSACIIEARHHCMGCRGTKKPHAIMKTSSLRGAFKEDAATRSELFRMLENRSHD